MLKRTIFVILSIICSALVGYSQLVVGQHHTALDTLTDTYLCSIDESYWSQDYTATVSHPNLTNIKINGETINGKYTFTSIDGVKTWNIEGTRPDGTTTQARLQFTFLPIVTLKGNVEKNVYNLGEVEVFMPTKSITSACRMKYRGSATNSSSIKKRNYHLKFEDTDGEKVDYKFFADCRKDNSWLLDAGTLDRLRVRNRILTDLWLDIDSRPYYNDLEPNALLGARGHMVEVFGNGNYQGVYNMSEAIDRKQLKLSKWNEETKEIHGQLWKSAQRSDVTKMYNPLIYNNRTKEWYGIEIKYPDIDDICPTDHSTMYNLIDFVANSSDEQFVQHAHEYIDLPVLMDIYIFTQLILAYDNMGKNIYWATHDRHDGPMLTPIPWDFDTSLGQSWKTSEYHPAYLAATRDVYTDFGNTVDQFYRRLIMLNVDGFVDKGVERYHELRSGALSNENITLRINRCIDLLKKSGAASREEQRWANSSDLGGRSVDFDTERAFVLDWIAKRLNWLDNKYFVARTPCDVNDDRYVDVIDVNMTISKVLGRSTTPVIYTYKFDINDDKTIDVRDVNGIINKILGK